MGAKSNIHWTHRSWNYTTGCSHESDGCRFCYAEALSLRQGWSTRPWTARNIDANLQIHPDRLRYPIQWQKASRIFVDSMSDLLHPRLPAEVLYDVIAVMILAPQHTYQVLTKRAEYMAERLLALDADDTPMLDALQRVCGDDPVPWAALRARGLLDFSLLSDGHMDDLYITWPLPHVWWGCSVEDQAMANKRLGPLLSFPNAVPWISYEPALGPVDLEPWLWEAAGPDWAGKNRADPSLGWVVLGGESGDHARPFDLDWARHTRDQCVEAGVPFFFKQSGGPRPGLHRELDGRLWEQYPGDVPDDPEIEGRA